MKIITVKGTSSSRQQVGEEWQVKECVRFATFKNEIIECNRLLHS